MFDLGYSNEKILSNKKSNGEKGENALNAYQKTLLSLNNPCKH
jgi:hypothetical protein